MCERQAHSALPPVPVEVTALCPLPLQVDAREPWQQGQRGFLSHCVALEETGSKCVLCTPSPVCDEGDAAVAPSCLRLRGARSGPEFQPQTPTPVVGKGSWPRLPAGRKVGVAVLTSGLLDLILVEGDIPQPLQSPTASCPDGWTSARPNPHSEWAPVGTPASQ